MSNNTLWILLALTIIISGCGGGSGSDTAVVAQNKTPRVSVANVTTYETELVTVNASAVDDDGSIVQYRWQQTAGAMVALSDTSSASISFIAPAVTADQTLTFQVTATDNQGASATVVATVIVKFNQPPLISLLDTEADEQSTSELAANITDDGVITAIAWLQIGGPAVTLEGADTLTLRFTAPDVEQQTALRFRLTVTDNLGKSSSAEVTVTVNLVDVVFNVQGFVSDAAISYAEVSTRIDGVWYSTTANASGEYNLNVKLTTDENSELIVLHATSPDSDIVVFQSLLGTTQQLLSAAGNDKTLSNNEMFATNITNVSAAHYALLMHANNGVAPTTSTELQNAMQEMNGDLLIPFATAIKLVLDYSADNAELALPARYADTAEWLADSASVRHYIHQAKLKASAVYDDAAAAILADHKLVKVQLAPDDVTGHYFVDRTSATSREVSQIIIREDKTGTWLQNNAGGDFSWSQTSDGVVLDFGTPGLLLANESRETHLMSVTLAITSQTADLVHFVAKKMLASPHSDSWVTDPEITTTIVSFKAFKPNALINASDMLELNQVYTLPYAGRNSEFAPDSLFNIATLLHAAEVEFTGSVEAGGVAYFTTADYISPDGLLAETRPYPWHINAAGQVIIALSDSEVVEISVLPVRLVQDNPVVSVRSQIGGQGRATTYVAAAKREPRWLAASVPGIYAIPGDPLNVTDMFWLELYDDKTAITVSIGDTNRDGVISDNEIAQQPGFWQIDEAGALHVRRYRSNENSRICQPTAWQPAPEDSCQLYNDRAIHLNNVGNLTAEDEQDLSIVIDHRFYDSFNRGGTTGNPQLGFDLLSWASRYNIIWKKVPVRPISLN
ncbi:hypothetical protein SAMN06297280_1377 [Arsukibacterium tuosuense]|uniref:PKD/Chitinase domain-containing protein n=1 Tax=Arsukibacterium tuosuense TaxID=1323745 RepID=A0A285IMY1_9GAMM|nr:hypothetical protein [Arsukibacterium tuosuense]SNY49365.1 hypothetical protein SAMN06297280_1377 [Arsukibacterium tuosuense]